MDSICSAYQIELNLLHQGGQECWVRELSCHQGRHLVDTGFIRSATVVGLKTEIGSNEHGVIPPLIETLLQQLGKEKVVGKHLSGSPRYPIDRSKCHRRRSPCRFDVLVSYYQHSLRRFPIGTRLGSFQYKYCRHDIFCVHNTILETNKKEPSSEPFHHTRPALRVFISTHGT